MKTSTEKGWSSAGDTFMAKNVYLVMNSLSDSKPVERLPLKMQKVQTTHLFGSLDMSNMTGVVPVLERSTVR